MVSWPYLFEDSSSKDLDTFFYFRLGLINLIQESTQTDNDVLHRFPMSRKMINLPLVVNKEAYLLAFDMNKPFHNEILTEMFLYIFDSIFGHIFVGL